MVRSWAEAHSKIDFLTAADREANACVSLAGQTKLVLLKPKQKWGKSSEWAASRIFCLLFFSLDLSSDNSGARYEITISHGWTRIGSDKPSLVKIIEGAGQELFKNKRLRSSCKDLVVVMVLVTADGIRVENEHSCQQGFH